ncbi:MAG TPA: polysaccharide deacetylase family protein [Opitutaceae bacterium]|nr:polysaccharide deacetylase family protein [Opitutaceae bacterium]
MTLLVLKYHRARDGRDGNAVEMLDAHFEYIAATYHNVVPGDPLPPGKLSVCLSFDGGYFDFFAGVFPLLRKHTLTALLAISPSVIRDDTPASPGERLAIGSAAAYAQPASGGFCTWPELEEMARSRHVVVAAHGYTHRPLNLAGADLDTELHVPRTLIGTRLGVSVDSFVFPYGKIAGRSLREARSGYRYLFANGQGTNSGWHVRVLHRIGADNLRTPTEPFETGRRLYYQACSVWNRLRRR